MRASLISALRGLHYHESEKAPTRKQVLPVLDPFDWVLPDSSGVVAFARQQAEAARIAAAQQSAPPLPPARWYFWAAWVVLGIGAGFALHLVLLQRQIAALG